MLPAGTAEGNHQVLEAAALVFVDAGVYQRQGTGEELVDAFLLIQILDYWSIPASERFEALLAARVGPAAVKGETEDANGEVVGAGGQALQFFRRQHAVEGVE